MDDKAKEKVDSVGSRGEKGGQPTQAATVK